MITKKDYLGMTHEDYLNLAKDIYADPHAIMIKFPKNAPVYRNETHFIRNGNLLRIAPDGTFRGLYPLFKK